MLRFLLDEHLNQRSVAAIRRANPAVLVESVLEWQGGRLVAEKDDPVLTAATECGLTLVPFDLRTIPSLAVDWQIQGRSHRGVVLVDERTTAPNDYGDFARALAQLWNKEQGSDWTNRVEFLKRPHDP